jgi:hypothetical protein
MGSKRGGNRILDKRARQVSPLIKIETFLSESNPLKFLQHQNHLNYKKKVNPKGGQNSTYMYYIIKSRSVASPEIEGRNPVEANNWARHK